MSYERCASVLKIIKLRNKLTTELDSDITIELYVRYLIVIAHENLFRTLNIHC